MSVGPSPEPSLLLARHENAHREHALQLQHSHQHQHQQHHKQHNLRHQHQHQVIHNAQKREPQAGADSAPPSVVTAVVTVSYLQQINVDPQGNTYTIETLLPTSPSPIIITTSAASAALDSAPAASSTPPTAPSTDAPAVTPQSLLPSPRISSSLTSAPSIPTNFASLIVNSNSTTSPLISGASNTTATFLNSTVSSTSFAYLASSSLTSAERSFTSSSSTPSSLSSSSGNPTSTGLGGYIGGASGVAPGGGPSSTAASGNDSSSDSGSAPSTPVVVGSVVGSVAGLALIIFFVLFLARWRKQRSMLSLGSGNEPADSAAPRDGPSGPYGGMAQRRSTAFAVPAALASLTGYNKRSSQKTERTLSSTAGSERGFYRVSGRKLPSVLHSGGDGYGGGLHEVNTLSGSSFYHDSTGFYGGSGPGPSTSSPLASPVEVTMDRDSGVPVMRPSPARTPVTEHGPFLSTATPPPPRRPDLLGRSHPSQDGSHGSRFTEEV
ncbi:uncharacterized protein BP5553_09518 [Venustampulla echinocandica]|uniref:Uncharacterized protein n=1 Tax=Venustampulla echinocandica TaxID=2656787 RepID=A0A370TD02_9HELO|nr:uncharacterized protein BP5553_09518 [Venustampulla echinocandica]RDL32116.1 hypothetical protein BP5553_09518 [Venustampulla echinocandica]